MSEEKTLPPETTEEKGRLVSMSQGSAPPPRVRLNAPERPEQEPSHRKFARVTIKYNRKDLQKRLDLEEWIDAQLQELYQYQLQEETEATSPPEPEIDIEDLLEVSNEEQKSKLQKILHECSRPTEVFISELLDRLRGLHKIASPQKKRLTIAKPIMQDA